MLYGNINNIVDYFCMNWSPLEATRLVSGGEPESGKIGTQMSSPLIVYAKESTTSVSAMSLSISGRFCQAFLAPIHSRAQIHRQNIWFEAETEPISRPLPLRRDLGASGAKYVYVLVSGIYGGV
jgi:hypothetical protein